MEHSRHNPEFMAQVALKQAVAGGEKLQKVLGEVRGLAMRAEDSIDPGGYLRTARELSRKLTKAELLCPVYCPVGRHRRKCLGDFL